ncbi:MAG: right-handed parallel beta-helix repeat-containing protein, partial [Candidatus Omnitrophica bacterium]|nr:right-handed parallel beta-helix repeat-containing protein [Candidatus Omnitrophota bacterium]
MEWDTTDTTCTLGGTASGSASATVSYPDAATLKVDVTTDFTSGETLIISALSFTNFTAESTTDNLELSTNGGTIYRAEDDKTLIIGSSIASTGDGGDWDAGATWAGGLVPGVDDRAVIATGDTVTFAQDDTTATCAGINIEAGGTLEFDTAADRTLIVDGDIHVYGTLTVRAATTFTTAIKFDCETDAQFGLIVHDTGFLDVLGVSKAEQNCLITAFTQDGAHNGYVYLMADSETILKYAEISYMGASEDPKRGIYADDVDGNVADEGLIVKGCDIHDCFTGIYVGYSDYNVFINNSSYSNTVGIRLGFSDYNLIKSNAVYNNAWQGIRFQTGCDYNTVIGNTAKSNQNGLVLNGSTYNKIYHNVSIDNDFSGIHLSETSPNNTLRNNIFHDNDVYEIYVGDNSQTGFVSDYNIIYDG